LAGLTGDLADVLPGLASHLPGLARYLADVLPKPLPQLSCALPQPLPQLSHALSQFLAELADTLPELSHRAARPQSLARGIRQPADGLTCGSARLDRLLCRLPDVVECLREPTTWSERLLTELTDVPDGVVDGMHQALKDLRVAVERRQRSVEDVVEILEPHLQ
jgi:hypothetical protein